VGLARAVVHDPPVLILDEPTTGLDPLVSRTVEQAVKDLARRANAWSSPPTCSGRPRKSATRLAVMAGGQVLERAPARIEAAAGAKDLREGVLQDDRSGESERGPAETVADE